MLNRTWSEHSVGVCDHVPAQVAGVVEASRALVAGVWLLSRVSPQVDLQAAVLREAFPTLRASVRLLPGVNAHVDRQCGLVDERLATKGTGKWHLPGVGRPVYDQVFAAEEALATEAAVQGFVDAVREDVLLLGELADVTGMTHVTISCCYWCFYCRIQGCQVISLQLAVSCQSNTVILHPSHRGSVIGTGGESQEAVMGDVAVRRQRAESLELRGGEEAVARLLQRPFPSSVNTHDSQLLMITCQAGGL